MARTKGTVKTPANIEPEIGSPLDARQRVATLADLTASGSFPYPWVGMIVYCSENGKTYQLTDADTTEMTSWTPFGSGSGGDISTEKISENLFIWFTEKSPYPVNVLTDVPSGEGEYLQIYTHSSGKSNFYYTYTDEWIELGNVNDEPGGPYYTVEDEFTVELFLMITQANVVDGEAREVAAGAMALAQEAIEQGGNAEDVAYSNPSKLELTNVKLALDDVIAKVYYVDPAITSFTMTPSTTEYEIGQSVSDIAFAWTYNKNMVSQTLTDCTLADETVRSATASGPYTSNKTFTLSASDGQNSTSQSKSISFKHKVYWGAASEPSEFTSEFILALTGKKFATNYKGSYNMNLGEGQYGYLAYPSSWGNVTSWWIAGFEVETYDCGTISFTNASGNTTTFRITRTSQPSLGNITAEVK